MNLHRPIILVGKTVLLVFCFWAVPSRAQNSPSISAPDCSPADVDPDIRISTSHDNHQALDVKLGNVSGHACYLRGELSENFMTVNIGAPITQNPVQTCYSCGRDGKSRSSEPLLLGNAQVAHQTSVWTNKQTSEQQIPCIQVNLLELFLNNKMLILFETQNPILSVCSQVLVSQFLLVAETNDKNSGDQENEAKARSLKLAADKDTYYVGQRIPLRLDMEGPDTGETSVERECSPLFERVRSPDGMSRFDQVGSTQDSNCKIITSTTLGSKRTVTLDVNSGHNNRWGGVGDHSIQFIDIDNTLGNEWLPEVTSNTIDLHIADPSTMKRTWGKLVEGLAADVTIDKNTYELGKDIPLHLAVENFSASVPIYGASPVFNPCDLLEVQVRDLAGQLVSGINPWLCTGGGPSGAWRYPKDKLVPLEWSLAPLGMLPDRPGVYSVVTIWEPFQGTDDTCEFCQITAYDVTNSKRYVVRSNVVTFAIQ
jgi:hypothetical protein